MSDDDYESEEYEIDTDRERDPSKESVPKMDSKDETTTLDKPPQPDVKKKNPRGKKIDPTAADKRRTTSISNVEKARIARMAKIQQQREAAANQYEIESSDEEEPTELVLQKKKKPILATATEARLMKLELMLEKLALQEKSKKKTKTIILQPAPVAKPEPKPQQEHLKKRILLDL